MSDTPETLRLSNTKLYDLDGNIVCFSTNELTSNNASYLHFVKANAIPSDGLTALFSTDSDGDRVVKINGTALCC